MKFFKNQVLCGNLELFECIEILDCSSYRTRIEENNENRPELEECALY